MKAHAKHSKGRRLESSNTGKRQKKKIILAIIIIIACLTALGILIWKDRPVEPIIEEQPQNNVVNSIMEETPSEIKEEVVSTADIPETISGYKVIGKIVIEKLGISNNIISNTSENSLKVAVTKFWGPDINTPGNFSITGHNTSNFFSKIHDMVEGDEFYLVGKDGRKVTYIVYDTYTTDPNDTTCIDQNEDGKREVTLITCNLGGITRFIVKAREKN